MLQPTTRRLQASSDRGEVAGPRSRRELRDVRDPQPVGTGGGEVAVDEVGEGGRVLVADRRAEEAAAVDASEMVALHEPRDPLAGHVVPGLGEVRPDPWHPVRAAAAAVEVADLLGQRRVRALPGGRAA